MKRLLILLLLIAVTLSGCRTGGGGEPAPSESVPVQSEEEAPPEGDGDGEPGGESGAPDGDGPEEEELPLTLRFTVPEGYTLARIGMTLEEEGICTVEEFIDAAQTGDYSAFPLVAEQMPNPNRCFLLEGYLFPDTYEIYRTDTPHQIIRRMLDHTESKINDEIRSMIAISGYTTDEILTIASIIEKEAFGEEVMPLISSVLHNRLNIGMKIQCDVTITYVRGAIQPFIGGDTDRYNAYYNTYTCPALPAGAICNPGLPAILAALRPADTDYLYFITDDAKQYYFTDDYEVHQQNMRDAGITPAS